MLDHVLPVKNALTKKTKSDTTTSTGRSSSSSQFGDFMTHELRLKREAIERAFEVAKEKDRIVMRLEEMKFLAISTKDFLKDDGMVTSMGIRHVKPYTLRGGPSTKLEQRLFKAWQLNNHPKNSSISSKPGRAHILPITTTMFAATTPENTSMAYRASTSANPNLVINSAFVEVNYRALKSVLRDRRRQMRNNDRQTKLEYFSKDYDEEREMEPRLEPTKATTPPLRVASPRILRREERTVGFEGA
ncbi:hypothetical protein Tco_1073686 [Tanacetum coccineum]